jgi:polysaccharide deacetylase family protein (PEP-CTERM system associated)
MTTHSLTIDLEDWHQLMHRRLTGEVIAPTDGVVGMTSRVLDILDEAQVRATFFVVGNVADTYPRLVREVSARGHEIGSHSYSHERIPRMERREFKRDVARSVVKLQDLTGQPVLGFRAPEFSVGHLRHWCFEVLCELGFEYDSSVFPASWLRYGIPDAPTRPFWIDTPSGRLKEFPLATRDLGRFRLPIAGGSYLRLLPPGVLRSALREMEAEGRSAVFYMHPYEFHPGWLAPHRQTWRTGMGGRDLAFAMSRILLHNFRSGAAPEQVKPLLAEFSFGPIRNLARRGSAPVEHRSWAPRPAQPAQAPEWSPVHREAQDIYVEAEPERRVS